MQIAITRKHKHIHQIEKETRKNFEEPLQTFGQSHWFQGGVNLNA